MESKVNNSYFGVDSDIHEFTNKGKARTDYMYGRSTVNEPLFNMHEDPKTQTSSLEDMEKRLFGISKPNFQEQVISDADFIPVKTGIGVKLMKHSPKHIMDAEDLEPLYIPQEHILEECLRREAERVAHQENLMNRVVYDSVDAAPKGTDFTENTDNAEEQQDVQ